MPKYLSLLQMITILENTNATLAESLKDQILAVAATAADAIAEDLDIVRGKYIEIIDQELSAAFGPITKHDAIPDLIDMFDAFGDWDPVPYPAPKQQYSEESKKEIPLSADNNKAELRKHLETSGISFY